MKCSKCGKRFNSLPAMAKHYRKKHPAAMKRKANPYARPGHPRARMYEKGSTARILFGPGEREPTGGRFCPHCGGFLG